MPRKRKTRAAQSRPTPKMREGDEGSNLDRDLKKEKLKTLLEDFDTQMENFFQKMKVDLKDMEKSVELSFRVEIAKIPQYIRDMDLDQYLKAGGTLTANVMVSDKFTQDYTPDTDPLETDMTALATLTKSKKKKKKALKPINEEGEDTGTIQKGTRGRKRGAVASADTNAMPPPPSTARTRRTTRQKQFETPYQKHGGPSVYGWETPLITPKFDPRLPVTPAMSRQPKVGEVCLSLAGSPLMNRQDKDLLHVQTSDKSSRTKIVLADKELDVDSIQVPDMTQTTMDYLRMLRDKLNQIPLTPK